jgi:hypothetical protein
VKRKKTSSVPRYKKFSKEQRINAAKSWIEKYNGKNLVKGYNKHFAVDLLCAVKELEILGIKIEPEYIEQLKQQKQAQENKRIKEKKLKEELELFEKYPDSDDNFYYIAGYTNGGAPYGVKWEEMGLKPFEEENNN